MAPISPHTAIYPKNKFKSVRVLHDGTRQTPHDFSIAEIELHDGSKRIGFRLTWNDWNDNPDKGYPLVRPGNPSWLLLPHDKNGSIKQFMAKMNKLFP